MILVMDILIRQTKVEKLCYVTINYQTRSNMRNLKFFGVIFVMRFEEVLILE